MYTYNGKQTRFHFNSDLSGDIIIFDVKTEKEIKVLASDILDFVAEAVRRKRIEKLEDMSTEEILSID